MTPHGNRPDHREPQSLETQLAASQAALAEAEAHHDLLAEYASDCVFQIGADQHFTYVSPACELIAGHRPEEYLAQPELMGEIVPGGPLTADADAAPVELEFRVERDNGDVRWLRHHCRPIFGAHGECLGWRGSNRDITLRKLYELALGRSDNLLRAMADHSSAVIFVKDLSSRYLFVNRLFETLFQVTAATIQGKTDHDLFPREMAEAFIANDRAVAGSGQASEREERVPHDDGVHTYLSLRFPLRDAAGEIYAVCGIATDITARKATEEQLGKLSLAVEQSSVSIVITDLDGRIEYVNPAFTRISGYTAAEVMGQNPRFLQSGRTQRATFDELWATLVADQIWYGEFVNRSKDGSEYIETATISPLRQADGRASHYVAVQADITPLKQAMADLRASESRLQLAQVAAGLGIYDHDLASDRITWDARTREFWGVGPETTITPEIFLAGLHPDDRAARQAAFERALDPRYGGEYHAEYRVIGQADGALRHVLANGRVFFEGGRGVRFIGTVQDISERKRLEQEVRERRGEMEQLVDRQVAAQTVAAIAHELNQPLNAISAYSEAALRMLRGGSKQPEKLERALQGATEQSQRAGRTLHELLDFLHKGEATMEAVDLNDLVREAINLAEESGYGGVRTMVELEPDLRAVQANRPQVRKVLLNLLHNSIEAMREAKIPLATIRIQVRTVAGKNEARVTVRDQGPGLAAANAQRVFEPFFTTKPKGIGLGLAISRALIEAHGGQLWADLDGPGATFHFTLPFAP
jgi:PAS domain S-box-containing protein